MRPLSSSFVIVAALATGCVGRLQPATATFRGITSPILLSRVSRIGGEAHTGGQRVGRVEGEALSLDKHSESRRREGDWVVTTRTQTTVIDNVALYEAVLRALEATPGALIRITMLRPWSRGAVTIVKSTVAIEGDVVVEPLP